MKFFLNNVPSVFLISLVLLANAQRSSHNLRDVDFQELARQNKITKQILEAFIQKKLGLPIMNVKAPSIHEILPIPMKIKHEEKNVAEREVNDHEEAVEEYAQDEAEQEPLEPENNEDDSLQSVESEQIDLFYHQGRKRYPSPPFEPELEPNSYRKRE